MSADMYSTNPTLMGSALIAAAPFAERFTASPSTEIATVYGMVGTPERTLVPPGAWTDGARRSLGELAH